MLRHSAETVEAAEVTKIVMPATEPGSDMWDLCPAGCDVVASCTKCDELTARRVRALFVNAEVVFQSNDFGIQLFGTSGPIDEITGEHLLDFVAELSLDVWNEGLFWVANS